jgi:hypothetical protein
VQTSRAHLHLSSSEQLQHGGGVIVGAGNELDDQHFVRQPHRPHAEGSPSRVVQQMCSRCQLVLAVAGSRGVVRARRLWDRKWLC